MKNGGSKQIYTKTPLNYIGKGVMATGRLAKKTVKKAYKDTAWLRRDVKRGLTKGRG